MDGKELFIRSVTTVQEMFLKIGDTMGSISLYYPMNDGYETIYREFKEASKEYPDIILEQLPQRIRVVISEQDCRRISELPVKETIRDLVALVNEHSSMDRFKDTILKKYPDAMITKSEYMEFDWLLIFPEDQDEDIYCLTEEFGQVTYHRYSKEEYQSFGFVIPEKAS